MVTSVDKGLHLVGAVLRGRDAHHHRGCGFETTVAHPALSEVYARAGWVTWSLHPLLQAGAAPVSREGWAVGAVLPVGALF